MRRAVSGRVSISKVLNTGQLRTTSAIFLQLLIRDVVVGGGDQNHDGDE